MNRAEFFKKLEQGLSRVSKEEAEAAIAYYHEYFDDAGKENEQKVLAELGSPAQIAARIRADSAVKSLNEPAPTVKKGISAIWWVLLAIFAAPIALPLAIAAAALVIGLVLAAIGIVAALVIALIAFFGSGVVIIIAGIAVIATSLPTAVFSVGIGLSLLGVTLLIGILVILAARAVFGGIARQVNKQLKKKSRGDDING